MPVTNKDKISDNLSFHYASVRFFSHLTVFSRIDIGMRNNTSIWPMDFLIRLYKGQLLKARHDQKSGLCIYQLCSIYGKVMKRINSYSKTEAEVFLEQGSSNVQFNRERLCYVSVNFREHPFGHLGHRNSVALCTAKCSKCKSRPTVQKLIFISLAFKIHS